MNRKQVIYSIVGIISISALLWIDIQKIKAGKIKLSDEDWIFVILIYLTLYFITGITLYFELSTLF
ncbi:hypothetical protein BKX95_11850 [Streptococcus iniae]|nr:hypothetical protein BKX95_11850 [Streptococcus iniae]